MKKVILFFLVLFYSTTAFCQQRYKQQLNHIATITFPDTPKMQRDSEDTFYSVAANGRVYVAQVGEAKKSLKELFTSHINDTIYAQIIEGSLTGTKGKLLYKKNIEVNGLDGVEFCYTAKVDSQKYYRYHQVFYFNNTLISYGYWTPDSSRSDNKALRAFFGTFKLTINDDDVRQDNVSDLAFRFGYVIGGLAFIGVIAGIGFGIVFIARKIGYKKRNSKNQEF